MEDYDDIIMKNVYENEMEYNNDEELIKGRNIELSEIVNVGSWKYRPMYMDKMGGGVLIWQIGYDEEKKELVIRHGHYMKKNGGRGEIEEKRHPIEENESGKKLIEQSLMEGRRRYINKYKEGYRPAGMDKPRDLCGCEPMLANKYKPPNETGKGSNVRRFPVGTMPKLDGIRALMRVSGNKVEARSRENNVFMRLDHIREQLLDFFVYLPENSELDGELYSMDMSFLELQSAVRTKKTKHKRHDEIKYYIFDIIEPNTMYWPDRYELLKLAYQKYKDDNPEKILMFNLVQNDTVMSHEEIIQKHNQYVMEGYEGLMIRHYLCKNPTDKDKILSQYKPRRSNNLLKYKEFEDEEVTIIGGEECVGNESGAVKFKVRDDRGNEYFVRPRGSLEKRRKWFKSLDKIVSNNTILTIRYQELSEYGVPRFPVGISFRNYE